MKKFILPILICAFALMGCQTEGPKPSATDTLPSPEDFAAGVDDTVDPGDSFFDYCNGAWLKQQDPHPALTIGGPYESIIASQQRVEQLKQTVPDIARFYQLSDGIYTQPEKELAFIEAKKAALKKPESKEEAYRAIGELMADGIPFPSMHLFLRWTDGQLKGLLVPQPSPLDDDDDDEEAENHNLIPLSATKGEASSAERIIIEGMGMNPDLFLTDPVYEPNWSIFCDYSPDELYDLMLYSWDMMKMYAIKTPQYTREYTQSQARTSLSYTISYYFAQQFVPQSLKDKYLAITKEIQASLRKRIQNVDWMSATTRQNAVDKLDHCKLLVGSPDQWFTDCVASYEGCETLTEAVCRGNRGIHKLKAHLLGGDDVFSNYLTQTFLNSNRVPEIMDLTLPNAVYATGFNSVLIYPAMILPPIVPAEGESEAFHYAAFVTIGHEFTHGFDSDGSKYDKNGMRHNWWTIADYLSFEDRKDNLIDCYDAMLLDEQRDPTAYGNGERTQIENIADLGGFLATLDAYKARLESQGFYGDNYKEQLRKFFEAYAYTWRIQYNDEKFKILINSDTHSHARLRVNGVVMNTDLWYELYDVGRDNILYLPPERRTYIW